MTREKNRARRLRALEMRKLHANSSANDNAIPKGLTDSYRPGQREGEDPFYFDDQPLPDVLKTANGHKRRKGADGDIYRPSMRSRPLSPHLQTPETDATLLPKVVANEPRLSPSFTNSQPLRPPKAERLPKAVRKEQKTRTLQNNIDRLQKQLSGVWVDDKLRIATERTLSNYEAVLKARLDLPAKNSGRRRYNVIRASERNRAQRLLVKAMAKEASLKHRLKIVRNKLGEDLSATVSDDQEEGGVPLMQDAATDKIKLGRRRKSVNSKTHPQALVDGDDFVKKTAYTRQTLNEIHGQLELAKQQTHIAEVDANYCCFAPLDQPYICLFPTDERGRFRKGNGEDGKKGGKAEVDHAKELQKDIEAGILRTNRGNKPPLWIEIDKRMKGGLFRGLTDTLGLGVDEHNLTEVGGKVDALERAMQGNTLKRRHSWMDTDEIAPEDLDSDSQSEGDSDNNDDDDDES